MNNIGNTYSTDAVQGIQMYCFFSTRSASFLKVGQFHYHIKTTFGQMRLKDVIGQQLVKDRFIQSVINNRVSHAQLIFGPPGSGGLPLALAFAQYITCESPLPDDSCGTCLSCIKNNKMIHPDVHYSFPVATVQDVKKPKSSDFMETFRQAVLEQPYLDLNDWFESLGTENKQVFMSVEESADILRKLSLKSYESPFKIVIQWMPEKMRTDAANKLLKIIEEPPDKTIFFLVAENRDQLLTTILSRLQQVKINKLSNEEVKQALITSLNLNHEKARSIAHLSEGNYREALHLTSSETVTASPEQQFIDWMRLCFNPLKNMQKLLQWVDAMAKSSGREQQKQFLSASIQTIRTCVLAGLPVNGLNHIDEQQQLVLERFIPFLHEKNMHEIISELNSAYHHVERNANAKILFLDLSFRISKLLNVKTEKQVSS